MITRVFIKDTTKTPLNWLPKLDNFKNGTEYVFKNGVNVIVGENGSGKSTLLNLIKSYLLVDYTECSRGKYNSNINRVTDYGKGIKDGADVYADYKRNTFRLCHKGEMYDEDILERFEYAQTTFNQSSSSTGESVLISIDLLFKTMFSKTAKLFFDYDQFKDTSCNDYYEYVEKHRVETDDSWTILMDEPDRNLSIDNIDQITGILSYDKPNTQVIAVVHNPLIIYSLSKVGSVNFIEMTKGYKDKIIDKIRGIVL